MLLLYTSCRVMGHLRSIHSLLLSVCVLFLLRCVFTGAIIDGQSVTGTFDASFSAFSPGFTHRSSVERAPTTRHTEKGLWVPNRLRVKAKLRVNGSLEPILAIFHYDADLAMTRSDYFTHVKHHYKRYVTDLQHHQQAVKYWVIHKQPKVPRMCVISALDVMPWSPSQLPQIMKSARFIGQAVVLREGADEIQCDQWEASWRGMRIRMCGHWRPLPEQETDVPMSADFTHPVSPAPSSASAAYQADQGDGRVVPRADPPVTTNSPTTPSPSSATTPLFFHPLLISAGPYELQVLAIERPRAHERWADTFEPTVASPAKCTAWG